MVPNTVVPAEQAEQHPWPEALLGAARLERRKAEAEQHPEGVGPADHEIFPEEVIAEKEEQLPYWLEGRQAPDQHPVAERDDKMQHPHHDRSGGEARDHPQQQVPEPGMALIFELGEEIERRVVAAATMKACSSSRHMAWRNNLITL